MNSFSRLICNLFSAVFIFASVICAPVAHAQQAVTGSAKAEVTLGKKPKPEEISAARRQLVEMLNQGIATPAKGKGGDPDAAKAEKREKKGEGDADKKVDEKK